MNSVVNGSASTRRPVIGICARTAPVTFQGSDMVVSFALQSHLTFLTAAGCTPLLLPLSAWNPICPASRSPCWFTGDDHSSATCGCLSRCLTRPPDSIAATAEPRRQRLLTQNETRKRSILSGTRLARSARRRAQE